MVLQSLVFIFKVSVAAVGGWFWKQGGEIVSKSYVNMLDMTSSYCWLSKKNMQIDKQEVTQEVSAELVFFDKIKLVIK